MGPKSSIMNVSGREIQSKIKASFTNEEELWENKLKKTNYTYNDKGSEESSYDFQGEVGLTSIV